MVPGPERAQPYEENSIYTRMLPWRQTACTDGPVMEEVLQDSPYGLANRVVMASSKEGWIGQMRSLLRDQEHEVVADGRPNMRY